MNQQLPLLYDEPTDTEYFRLLAIRADLRTEITGGMKQSPSAFSVAKHTLGIKKGTKEYVLNLLDKKLRESAS